MKSLSITVHSPAGVQELSIPSEHKGLHLAEILRKQSHALNMRCGGRGLCDGCLVQLTKGRLRSRANDKSPVEPAGTMIRACQCLLDGESIEVLVPAKSVLTYEPQVVSNFKTNITCSHDPIWRAVELTQAEVPSSASAEAIGQVLGKSVDDEPVGVSEAIAFQVCTRVAAGQRSFVTLEMKEEGWVATQVLAEMPDAPVGVAIDIGTTTVALLVVDLQHGKILGSASGFNRQMHLGDDVLTRINLCTTDKQMLDRLQSAVVQETIERLLPKALQEAGGGNVVCINIAANTTMLHLLAGVDPSPMGFAPFTAPFLEYKTLPASQIHLHANPKAPDVPTTIAASSDASVHLLPSAAAYVGADITAGVVTSGLLYDDGPSLFVDVGTNGEIVFKSGQRMWGTATAAGPAFEGSRMTCGMRAGRGAISHIRLRQTDKGIAVETEVIGGGKANGICGSAYVDFLAQAAKVGLLTESGRFAEGVAADRVGPYRDSGRAFTVARGHGGEPVVISEQDIASLLQAKAAIAAGILTLLKRVGIQPHELKTVYLAGGFGMHLDIANTVNCGLLPGLAPAQVQLVGNTSLAGAYMSMLDASLLDEIKEVAREIEIVELNLDPDFESCYIDQLMLPKPVEGSAVLSDR